MTWTFTLTKEVTETFSEGWGVAVEPLYEIDEEEVNWDERICDVVATVVRIDKDAAELIGGVWCVSDEVGHWFPIENFEERDDLTQDDTHDFRDRWFATEDAAREHATYTVNRFQNPSPWESFVRL
jgi:hypothetical protein